jgi:hypothetical protein
MKIVGLTLEVTSHRLVFRSNTAQSLLIKGEAIEDVSITVSLLVARNRGSLARTTSSSCTRSTGR